MSGGIDAPQCLTIIGRLVSVYSLDAKEMKMGAYPKTLVLYRNKDFSIPKFALESLFYLVKNVTGETNLVQPISKRSSTRFADKRKRRAWRSRLSNP